MMSALAPRTGDCSQNFHTELWNTGKRRLRCETSVGGAWRGCSCPGTAADEGHILNTLGQTL
eukprot:COSAG03_NODE_16367_length_404_cov_0.550820_1_plen_61_part_01